MSSKTSLEHTVVDIAEPKSVYTRRTVENYAANAIGKDYPKATASYTDTRSGNVWYGIDGRIFYDNVPRNRWDNNNSPNTDDWYAVDFGPGREISINEVKVYIYSDVVTGEGNIGKEFYILCKL